MTARRFTDKPELDPSAVRSLPRDHPALCENRTLFPSTVVDVDDNFDGRLLVSGRNNRKLGETVAKGKFKGYALYGLSLEERATCPSDCAARAFCYGNGMQMARRHRIRDLGLFEVFLEDEIRTILADHAGLLVRLHVLGDFPSIEYAAMWADLLDEYERLACYGYTAWDMPHPAAAAIGGMKQRFGERFRIRWSRGGPDGTTIIDRAPEGARVKEGLVCPAQTDATACCASCGLCWEGAAKKDTIVFIKHGPKSLSAMADRVTHAVAVRSVTSLQMPPKRAPIISESPSVKMVRPQELKIESAYQRDLSGKSLRLIRKIVAAWDWTKFKAPVCAETAEGLFVIDGQHTAIAAASHPDIKQIPVMIVAAEEIEQRAGAFVAHNRDRLTMTPAQIFYGEVAAGDNKAADLLDIIVKAGATVPRSAVTKLTAKAGHITAINDLRKVHAKHGRACTARLLKIAVASGVKPLTTTVIRALAMLLTEPRFAPVAQLPDADVSAALASFKNVESEAQVRASETEQSRFRSLALMLEECIKKDAA